LTYIQDNVIHKLHDKLIRQHVLAYFSSHRQALVLVLRRNDGLKNKPKGCAQLTCKVVYEGELIIYVIDNATGICHIKIIRIFIMFNICIV